MRHAERNKKKYKIIKKTTLKTIATKQHIVVQKNVILGFDGN